MSAVFPTLFYTFRKLPERFVGVAMGVSAGARFSPLSPGDSLPR
jgi:hypothetical protein